MGRLTRIRSICALLALFPACAGDPSAATDAGTDASEEDTESVTDTPTDTDGETWSVTFFLVADTHCDPPPSTDQAAMANAMDRVAAEGVWPAEIDSVATGFEPAPIGVPAGVIFAGDLTGSGDISPWNNELECFRQFYEEGFDPGAISLPAYVGLGNHDLDREGVEADLYRAQLWAYVESRHSGSGAPVPAGNFDPDSFSYSWDWEGLHLAMTHKWAGDTTHEHPSALDWLADDLSQNTSDGRPTIIVQHYGMDAFGQEDRWWTDQDREDLAGVLEGHEVLAILAGHSHFAMTYHWKGIQVIQANNAKAEIDEGNDDGNGSFAIIRVSNLGLRMVTCRWLNEEGDFEMVAPLRMVADNRGR